MENELKQIQINLQHLGNSILQVQKEIVRMKQFLLSVVRINHAEQLKQLKAVQQAFLLNVERDEELRDAMSESADAWNGC